jgi:protein TonB
MGVRANFLVAILVTSFSGAMGQNGAVTDGHGQAATTTNNAPVGSKDRPIRISAGVLSANLVHKEEPVYPEEARADKVTGVIVMAVAVDDQGKVANLSVVSGPELLRAAALTSARQWKYRPYLLNGRPVFVLSTITINFSITE